MPDDITPFENAEKAEAASFKNPKLLFFHNDLEAMAQHIHDQFVFQERALAFIRTLCDKIADLEQDLRIEKGVLGSRIVELESGIEIATLRDRLAELERGNEKLVLRLWCYVAFTPESKNALGAEIARLKAALARAPCQAQQPAFTNDLQLDRMIGPVDCMQCPPCLARKEQPEEATKVSECQNCKKKPGTDELHSCPYQEEINNNFKAECNCCEFCQNECAMEI